MSSLGLAIVVAMTAVISAAMILALLPALERHVLAHPNARSSHRRPTPQGGGIAVIAASLAVAAGAITIGPGDPTLNMPSLWALFIATAFLAAVGMVDDIRTIEVAPRLLLQAFAIVIVIASLPAELRVAPAVPWWLERTLLFVACLWFVNLTNFMDGIDWMTVAEFVPMAVGIALIGLLGALPMASVVVALALCGGLIGFAPFNRPVARIFLGDVGSLPIGLVFAWLLVQVGGHGHVVAALLLPLYYLADAPLTLLRRMKNGEPFWQAHRTHFYQLAVIRGFSVPEAIARVFTVNIALVALAIGSVVWPGTGSAAIALVAGCAAVGWLLVTFAQGRKP
jgi:UDP-N-acetylmuramyl pentapeptide phosphotransferase/UDP-N-acetylglucosamine-1-phosphate transferase